MRRTILRAGIVLGLALCVSPGCDNTGEETTYDPPEQCQAPCKDDPSKTCNVPCSPASNPGPTLGSGGGGVGGSTGIGGAAGGVTGTVVQFTTMDFIEYVPYTDPITIVAPGLDTMEVAADAVDGFFTLPGAVPSVQWVLAKDLDGTGGAYSTYSLQDLGGANPIVPVVPVDVLDAIAVQIDVLSLVAGRGHVVLDIADEAGQPFEGAEVFLAGSDIGYQIGPSQYSSVAVGTGTQGRAVALNVPVASKSQVTVEVTVNGVPVDPAVVVQMAPDVVTYARVGIVTP